MKLICENIPGFLKTQLLLLSCLLLSRIGMAQADTTSIPMTNEDSGIAIEQADTIYETQDFFARNNDNASWDTFHLREVPASVVDSLKKDDAFWYADYVLEKQKDKANESRTGNVKPPSRWMNMTTLVVILVAFLLILTWYLYKNNIIRKTRTIAGGGEVEEPPGEDIFSIDYQIEMEKAIHSSNYRFAIRLMFLQLLKKLSRKNIIQYKHDRTNFDYLSQLYSTGYYNDFFRLTRNYEYAWYGKFDISQESFATIKMEFEKFDRRLS